MPQTLSTMDQAKEWLFFALTLDDVIKAEKQQYPDHSTLTALRHLISYAATDNWPAYLTEYDNSYQLLSQQLTAQDENKLLNLLLDFSKPLKDFTPEWEYHTELLAKDIALETDAAAVPLSFSGQATVQAELDVYNKADAATDHQLEIRLSQALVRLGLDGMLNTNFGTGTVPLANGSWGLSAKSEQKASYDLFFAAPELEDLIQVLPKAISALPTWADLNSALQQLNEPYAPQRISLALTGSVEATAELSLGQQLIRNFTKAGADANAPGVQLKVAATLSSSLLLSGAFELILTKLNATELEVKLTRTKAHEKQAGLTLGGSLKVTGAEQLAEKLLTETTDPEPLLEQLKQLANPYALLQDKVKTRLSEVENPLLVQLGALLFNLTEPEDVNAELQNYLQLQITDLLSKHFDPWQADSPQLINKLVASLTAQPELQQKLSTLLTPELNKLTTEVRQNLQQQLEQWAKQVIEQPQLLKKLDAAGLKLQDLVTLPTPLQAVLKRSQNWLTSYGQKRQALAQAITEASERQLGLSFMASVQQNNQSQTLCSFVVSQSSAISRALFKSCLTGQLKSLPELLKEALAEGSISQVEYLFKQQFSQTTTTGLTFDLFGFELSWKKVVSYGAVFAVDMHGHVVAAKSTADISARFKFLGEQREASLTSIEELIDAQSAPRPQGSLTFSYSYAEDNLKVKEATEFFNSLVAAGLASQGLNSRALALLDLGSARHQNNSNKVELNLTLQIATAQLFSLVEQNPKRLFETACAIQFEVAEQLVSWWKDDKCYETYSDWTQNTAKLRKLADTNTHPKFLVKRLKDEEELIWEVARCADGWEKYLQQLKIIRQSFQTPAGLSYEQLQQISKEMSTALSRWVVTKDAFNKNRISWRMAALARLLCHSCRLDPLQVTVLEIKQGTTKTLQHSLLK
ncbi:hypothetical protein Rhein_0120 [Rheinheimera sp. A13L]|uniref:hypothetical protein n=1 Tax=Rheinheimera sp. A13L TaxID=506534 RepID=UPI0002124800|nr:hypothetical protein [Rheinheimera sp. A13L]EGM79660.1 hypothetical protein Rhein_0120 [Rheinheimera sp. A13L]